MMLRPPPFHSATAIPLMGPTALEGCRYRLHRELSWAGEQVPVGTLHTRSVAVVAERRRDVVGVPRILSAEETYQHMRAGFSRILGATLTDADSGFTMVVDVLHRVEEAGRVAYFPVIVVGHKVTDPRRAGSPAPPARVAALTDPTAAVLNPALTPRHHRFDELRVGLAVRLLQRYGVAPAMAGGGRAAQGRGDRGEGMVYGVDGYGVVHTVDLREVDGKMAAAQALRETVIAGEDAPVQPLRVRECRHCPFFQHGDGHTPSCVQQLEQRHDVSVIVRGAEARRMQEMGITTYDELAAQPAHTDPVLLARARVLGRPIIRRREEITVPRAAIEVDIDAEAYLNEGAYLWGMRIAEPGQPPRVESFVTWGDLGGQEEAENFTAFFHRVVELRDSARARGLSFAAYCYSQAAENHWLRLSATRFADRGGPSPAVVAEFLNSPEWVDMLAVMRRQFLAPEFGLKKLAPLAGFTWSDAAADGEASLGWYRQAVGRDGSVDPAQRQHLVDYNRDDTLATAALREWLSDPVAMAAIPTVAQLAAEDWRELA